MPHLPPTVAKQDYSGICGRELGQNHRTPEIILALQSGESLLDCEPAIQVLQDSVQRAEEKPHEILRIVCEIEPLDVLAGRTAKGVLCGIRASLPSFRAYNPETRKTHGMTGRKSP